MNLNSAVVHGTLKRKAARIRLAQGRIAVRCATDWRSGENLLRSREEDVLLRLWLLFVVVPLLELAILIWIGRWVGAWTTIGAVILIGATGGVAREASRAKNLDSHPRESVQGGHARRGTPRRATDSHRCGTSHHAWRAHRHCRTHALRAGCSRFRQAPAQGSLS